MALLDRYETAEEAWRTLDEPEMDACLKRAQQELEWIEEHSIRVWTLADEDYPYRLRQCPDKPLLLYGKGNLQPSEGHVVSIVGTRQPTQRGKELTEILVRELHERLESVTIVSGGAYGIDIAAHRAAIQYGVPTIIVPAHGLDRIYPLQHRPEAVASLEKGGLLTEFPSGTEPLAPFFVQRNRIVAGLADAVVVVESRERGGSLISAQMAVDYDRELFAFPGRPTDVSSSGCNKIIRQNKAGLITCADDLIDAMQWTKRDSGFQPVQTQLIGLRDDLSAQQQDLLQKLQEAEEGMHINLLVMETERPYGDVASDLMMLEIQGLVRSLPGGIYRFVR
ncbi:MAG: DNA-processing protein DprA [Paludibacteraceae bacterium]|nr:DNA-processing protein DprA [Paludibacteraceae bacterium]